MEMPQYRIILRDHVTDWEYGSSGGYRAVILSTDDGPAVVDAVDEAVNAISISTDFRDAKQDGTDPDKVIVRVGSWQAQEEFVDRLKEVRASVDAWRANEAERLKNEKESEKLEELKTQLNEKEQRLADPWQTIMLLCVGAALIILLTD